MSFFILVAIYYHNIHAWPHQSGYHGVAKGTKPCNVSKMAEKGTKCIGANPTPHLPPHPNPHDASKKWVSSGGFQGGSRQKTHWGAHVLDKRMTLRGVKPSIQPLGVEYSYRPKNTQNEGGGSLTLCAACKTLI